MGLNFKGYLMPNLEGHSQDHKYDYKELGIALLCIIVLGLSAALAFVILKQQANATTLHDVKQSNQILIDCTTPGHKCYEDNRANIAALIQKLESYDQHSRILVSHCIAIGNISIKAITNCVNRGG